MSIESVQKVVASHFSVRIADLKGPRRHQGISRPRMIAMYLSRQLTGASFPKSACASAARTTRPSSTPASASRAFRARTASSARQSPRCASSSPTSPPTPPSCPPDRHLASAGPSVRSPARRSPTSRSASNSSSPASPSRRRRSSRLREAWRLTSVAHRRPRRATTSPPSAEPPRAARLLCFLGRAYTFHNDLWNSLRTTWGPLPRPCVGGNSGFAHQSFTPLISRSANHLGPIAASSPDSQRRSRGRALNTL
ncbi:helix-turn-helix domain-containing protein [Nannocystis pusilla]|uniref:helix-turn-helix domain-containing protein n=1 Tax=Nannocystis pusilla TaxID=889268 RepID=UPI003B7A25DB